MPALYYFFRAAVPVPPSAWKYFPCMEGKSDARYPSLPILVSRAWLEVLTPLARWELVLLSGGP